MDVYRSIVVGFDTTKVSAMIYEKFTLKDEFQNIHKIDICAVQLQQDG